MAMKNPVSKAYQRWRLTWRDKIDSPIHRFFAHFDAHISDHAFLRLSWHNLHQLADGVFRSNQPSPKRIKKLQQMGIKTIINLRGPSDFGSYVLEERECEKQGIKLINQRMYSRRLPKVKEIHDIKELFETVERPFLMHCKSGADRAGISSALFVILNGGTIEEAQEQLSFKYLHVKAANTGLLDYFFQCYKDFYDKNPIEFMDWVDNYYDRDTLKKGFQSNSVANWLVDGILRRE